MGYIFWLFTDFYFYSDGTTNRPTNAIDYHSITHWCSSKLSFSVFCYMKMRQAMPLLAKQRQH